MKALTTLTAAALIITGTVTMLAPPAMALGIEDASILSGFDSFDESLERTGRNMRSAYDNSQRAAAERYQAQAKTTRETELSAMREFQRGQCQMVLSGGAYNSQGFIWGWPLGLFTGPTMLQW